MVVGAVSASSPPGTAVVGNILQNAQVPAGSAVSISKLRVPGFSVLRNPGNPVAIVDASQGVIAGSLLVFANGTYIFTPEAR